MKTFNLEKFAASPLCASFLAYVDGQTSRENKTRNDYIDEDNRFRKDGGSICNGLGAEDFWHDGDTISVCGLLATLNGCDHSKKWRGTEFYKPAGEFVQSLLRLKRGHLFRSPVPAVKRQVNRVADCKKYASMLGDLA